MSNGCNDTTACVVKLEFKRIQEFLFAVPRLKAMIGANALLGETIRENFLYCLCGKGKPVDDCTDETFNSSFGVENLQQ